MLVTSLLLGTLVHSARAQGSADVARLGWIAGCWEQRSGTRVSHEQWMAPLGGMMMGMNRTVAGNVVRSWEQLRIEVLNGKAAYVSQPSGQTLASFPATYVSDTMAVFENPQHDFPTKIIYRKAGADSLRARIEGPQGGTTRGIDFPMKRVRCGT
ncbi:MAG: DUF6265 family protein [Gemmatimonadota bacterium]